MTRLRLYWRIFVGLFTGDTIIEQTPTHTMLKLRRKGGSHETTESTETPGEETGRGA